MVLNNILLQNDDEKMSLARQKVSERTQILDEAARMRRQKKALDALDKDNFQETPTLLVSEYKLKLNKNFQQKFNIEDTSNQNPNGSADNLSKKRKLRPESKLRFRKTLNNLIEEEVAFVNCLTN